MAGTYLLEMIILFLYKFKTASKFLLAYLKNFTNIVSKKFHEREAV